MNFELRIIDLHWIDGTADDPEDWCLHGNVFVRIGDEIIDDGVSNSGWTVSAGAYYMLETLHNNHKQDSGNQLLPCCGSSMHIDEKTDTFDIIGCINGLDWSVTHENGKVRLTTALNTETVLTFAEYKSVVVDFADEIKAFYAKCSPKVFMGDFAEYDKRCYERFWVDWDKMRNDKEV